VGGDLNATTSGCQHHHTCRLCCADDSAQVVLTKDSLDGNYFRGEPLDQRLNTSSYEKQPLGVCLIACSGEHLNVQ
jgi:hypothetical protein